ncbi:hypothetical protein GGX14DRAFT_563065 [Mycena pura]|uniref:Uncharacterized protein n=1 Tax=Mycena pura TaxID=153505 RepID=A0AAD6YEF4_9AGAR|nr:hypothetical protein GGX14DRAFT_563065 [Mycena pura]
MIPDQRKHIRTLHLRASPQLLPTPGRALHLKKHGATISNTSATLRHRAPCLAWSRPRRLKRHSLRAAPRIHFPCYHPKEEKTSLKTTLDIDPQPPAAPPDTPPHKSAKRSHLDSQTRDVPHSERESPSHRYAGKGPRAYAHPLVNPFQRARHRNTSPTPTRLQTTSLTDDEYLTNDLEYSPLDENHPFFLPNPTPSPPTFARAADLAPSPSASPSPLPPPPPSQPIFAPLRFRAVAQPVQCRFRALAQPLRVHQHTEPPPPSPTDTAMPGADDMDDVVIVVFKAPTREAILAATLVGADKNPHRPSPAHNPNDPQAFAQYSSVQSNDPLWTAPVMPDHVVLENMSDKKRSRLLPQPPEQKGLVDQGLCHKQIRDLPLTGDLLQAGEDVGVDVLVLVRKDAAVAEGYYPHTLVPSYRHQHPITYHLTITLPVFVTVRTHILALPIPLYIPARVLPFYPLDPVDLYRSLAILPGSFANPGSAPVTPPASDAFDSTRGEPTRVNTALGAQETLSPSQPRSSYKAC